MITKASTAGIYVSDQDQALDFYTNKLGFEKLTDEPMGSDARWIEVAPAGAQTRLVLYTPPGQEDKIGTFSNVIFSCDDMNSTYQELKGRGVEFSENPSEQPWGIWAQFKDPDGNEFGLIERD
ncbi:MAG: VOC family protein [Actinomycetota bacterium]|jgi:predicted enzyme related to lactoylglutathione lyase|nr:VOC family protein [Actinomycetota bacterium]